MSVGIAALMWWTLAWSSSPAQQPQQSPFQPGTSSISGRVVAGDTGKPIRGATIEVVIWENLSGRFKQTTTDGEGKYTLSSLPAGHYQLAAFAPRYLRMQYGQQQAGPVGMNSPPVTLAIADGQAFSPADFTLPHVNAIEGVVVDEFGDPAPNISVQASQVMYGGGRKRLMPSNVDQGASSALTDDKGHFRLVGLVPGDYYVEALSGAFADPDLPGGFAITFYPGTIKASAARVVTVGPGHDILDLTFPLTAAATGPVTGTIVDENGDPVAGANLVLMPSERAGTTLFMQVRGVAGPGGRFSFRNVPAGAYTIQAFGRPLSNAGNLGAYAFGYLTFTFDATNPQPLTVRVPKPRAVRGRITFEGDSTTWPRPTEMYVNARQVEFESAPIAGGPSPYKVNDDWTFQIDGMSGFRLLTAAVRAGGWVLKSVMLNGTDVTDTPLDLREQDVEGVELVFTQRVTTLSGTVTVPADERVSDYNILIFADDDTKWGVFSRYVSFTRPGPGPSFTLKALPPGSYVATLLGPSIIQGEWQDPEFLAKQRTRSDAVRFSLTEGGSATVALAIKR